jgi:tetratricopeptide (TPR) repeat protein
MKKTVFVVALIIFAATGLFRNTSALVQSPGPDASKQLAEAAELTNKVINLFSSSKFDEALPIAKRALELRERNLSPDDILMAAALINLGEIYLATKKPSNAKPLFERAVRIYEKTYGSTDMKLANLLNRLGGVYFDLNDYKEAERALLRSLAIKEKVLGAESDAVADSLDNLGQMYRFHGESNKSEAVFDRALKIVRSRGEKNSAATERVLRHYRCLFYETEQSSKLEGLRLKYMPDADNDASAAANKDSLRNGGVLNGKALRLVQPGYPPEATQSGASGIVVVEITIDETGKVTAAEDYCGGNRFLVKPSLEAAYASRFTPTLFLGQPVKVNGLIIYRFVR